MPVYLKNTAPGEVTLKEGPIPEPEDGQILVKVEIAAGNPVDLELNSFPGVNVGTTVGQEFSGTVTKLGGGVTKFQVGDRVAGFTLGTVAENLHWGSFGEYAIGFAWTTFKIPEKMSFEEAALLPVALHVTAYGLYRSLELPKPGGEGFNQPLFIAGGATTMGSMAIQFAKASGVTPIITSCSARNVEYVKSLGADITVDYNDPEYTKKVRDLTDDNLSLAFDTVSHGDSFTKINETIGSAGGKIVFLNPPPETAVLRQDVQPIFVNIFTAFGVPFTIFGFPIPAEPETKEFVENWLSTVAEPLINEGKLKSHGIKVLPNGLASVKEGWELYRTGGVSGSKLLYRIADTPGVAA